MQMAKSRVTQMLNHMSSRNIFNTFNSSVNGARKQPRHRGILFKVSSRHFQLFVSSHVSRGHSAVALCCWFACRVLWIIAWKSHSSSLLGEMSPLWASLVLFNLLWSSSAVVGREDDDTLQLTTVASCSKPSDNKFVRFIPDSPVYAHRDYLHLKCDHWSKTVTCENGTWSSLPSWLNHCQTKSNCPAVRLDHGHFDSRAKPLDDGSYPYKSRLTFSCEYGYQLEGPYTIICLEQSRWTSQPPTCVVDPLMEDSVQHRLIDPVIILSMTVVLLIAVLLFKVFLYALHAYEIRKLRMKHRKLFREYKYQSICKRSISIQPVFVITAEPQVTDL